MASFGVLKYMWVNFNAFPSVDLRLCTRYYTSTECGTERSKKHVSQFFIADKKCFIHDFKATRSAAIHDNWRNKTYMYVLERRDNIIPREIRKSSKKTKQVSSMYVVPLMLCNSNGKDGFKAVISAQPLHVSRIDYYLSMAM